MKLQRQSPLYLLLVSTTSRADYGLFKREADIDGLIHFRHVPPPVLS